MVDGETMIQDILELIDQGMGLASGGSGCFGAIERGRCVRRSCTRACVNDSGFCAECHAYMTDKTTVDPVAAAWPEPSPMPWSGQYPPTTNDEWLNYLGTPRREQ